MKQSTYKFYDRRVTTAILIKHQRFNVVNILVLLCIVFKLGMEYNKKKNKIKDKKGLRLPPIQNENVKTVVDVDPEYFSLVEGRPIHANKSYNTYKRNIREVALKNTVQGFLSEEILRIDKEIMTERNIYENAAKHFDECKKSFDKFLAYDNDKTICIMKKSDALNRDLLIKTEEHKKVHYEMAALKSKIQYIDETLLILLSFENFLHKTAPQLWQTSENIDITTQHTEIFSVDTDIFKKIDASLIEQKLHKLPRPINYFVNPEQLLNIFYLLEKQNLNCLLIAEEMNSLKNKFLKVRDRFEEDLHMELKFIQEKINEIMSVIQWHEIKESELKEVFFKILKDKIQYLVSSEMALQLYTYVEYAYEKNVAENNTELSIIDMVLALETEFNNILLDLSTYDLNIIKDIEKKTFENSRKEIKDAKKAQNLLRNVDKISKRLNAAYLPGNKKDV